MQRKWHYLFGEADPVARWMQVIRTLTGGNLSCDLHVSRVSVAVQNNPMPVSKALAGGALFLMELFARGVKNWWCTDTPLAPPTSYRPAAGDAGNRVAKETRLTSSTLSSSTVSKNTQERFQQPALPSNPNSPRNFTFHRCCWIMQPTEMHWMTAVSAITKGNDTK